MISQLQIVLGVDNNARKEAEAHLSKIREGDPDKYAGYLTSIITNPEAPQEIRSLSAVILRRTLGNTIADKKQTLWEALSEPCKEYLKTTLLQAIQQVTQKELIHKFANLLVEIAGGIYEQD